MGHFYSTALSWERKILVIKDVVDLHFGNTLAKFRLMRVGPEQFAFLSNSPLGYALGAVPDGWSSAVINALFDGTLNGLRCPRSSM